jgi:hypothetical protein
MFICQKTNGLVFGNCKYEQWFLLGESTTNFRQQFFLDVWVIFLWVKFENFAQIITNFAKLSKTKSLGTWDKNKNKNIQHLL